MNQAHVVPNDVVPPATSTKRKWSVPTIEETDLATAQTSERIAAIQSDHVTLYS